MNFSLSNIIYYEQYLNARNEFKKKKREEKWQKGRVNIEKGKRREKGI